MRPYEIMVILEPNLEEDAIRSLLDRATTLLQGRGANVGRVDRWGKRRFAYEIKRRTEGYYVVIEVTGEPAAMADADRMLHLADEVVRHKIVRLPEKVAGRARREAPEAAAGGAEAPAGR